MRPTITPAPSPKGTNRARMFLYHCPAGSSPELALDAALRRAKDVKGARDDDPSQVNLGQLRQKLEYFLQQALPEDRYQSAVDMLDECGLPGGQVYGEAGTQDADPDATAESLWTKYPDHAQDVRKYLADRGFSDDDIAAAIGEMPKNAIEDRRGGRDRKRGAMDRQHMAADSFEAMYGTSRIKMG